MTKTGRKRLLAKHHTGKIRPHAHTSYGGLAVVLLMAVVPLVAIGNSAVSAAPEDTMSSEYGTYAVVLGEPPQTAPTIGNITNGRVFTSSDEVVARGSCPSGTLVKIFKNDVFSGAALCQNGTYQVSTDLFIGTNRLVARAYNTNDAVSPDSDPVTVQLTLPGIQIASTEQPSASGATLAKPYLTSEMSHRGANVGDTMTWPLAITGGQPPYAVSVAWGDGKTELISRTSGEKFDIKHAYKEPGGYRGSYTIVIKSTDQSGATSYLQLVAIVSGDKKGGVVTSVSNGYNSSFMMRTAWQVLAAVALVLIGFWIGEKREARTLKHVTKGMV